MIQLEPVKKKNKKKKQNTRYTSMNAYVCLVSVLWKHFPVYLDLLLTIESMELS